MRSLVKSFCGGQERFFLTFFPKRGAFKPSSCIQPGCASLRAGGNWPVFGVPGLSSVVAGIVAGRIIERRGAHGVLLAAMLVQGGLTAPLILLGAQSNSLWLLIPALFIGFFGHITAAVAATVTATSDVPDTHKGLASGLVTTSQRVAVTVGIPVLGAVVAIRTDLLAGIQLALAVDVVLTLTAVVIIWAGLNGSRPAGARASVTR
jgi:predicted MFS family arabinose efflux permease